MQRVAAALILLALGCGTDDTAPAPAPAPETGLPFPKGFLFGTAVAGFQVDMGCPTLPAAECDDTHSDWYAFITAPELQKDATTYLAGDPPSAGPGQWELYAEDIERARTELSNNGMRFSFEWSRIFPTATDDAKDDTALAALADPKAVAHYHAMLKALKDSGITPLVTLNHYSLPTWIHDGVGCHKDLKACSPKGWVDKERTVREIARYAGFCAREFGAEVDLWATENEPFAVIFPGYIQPTPDRTNPPAVPLALAEAKIVFAALIEAHARMYDAVKAGDTGDADGDGKASMVGLVYSMSPVKAKDPEKPADVQAAKNVWYLWNMAFLNAVAKGDFDGELDGTATHRDDLAGRMDYIGINYYTRITVEGLDSSILPDLSPLATFNPLTLQPWEDYPRGLYEMALVVKDELHLPAYITENGAADPLDDGTEPRSLVQHMTWLQRAITEGADVRGYFVWSLMDNYEWNHGMSIRMGLYAVDKNDTTKARKPRQGVAVYASIASMGRISDELQAKYPIDPGK